MGQVEVAVAFIGPIAAFIVWRYVERALDWLEPRALRVISSSLAMIARYAPWSRWQWVLVFMILSYAAVHAWISGWVVGVAAIAGFAIAVCINSMGKWSPILWGLSFIAFGAYTAVHIGVVNQDPPWAAVGLPFVVAGLLMVRDSLRLVRSKRLRGR